MMIGVCGVACEACPRRTAGKCPNGQAGCVPRENPFCEICTCASRRGIDTCFRCLDFPCETTRKGPISHGYCQYISGKG
ncbi:MAG: hypothetical protein A4E31_01506 [Methanomassiliicoccales archaeon PtaU1.Bin030]|jgi:hypothetical protein|nr:MAG: hypothetical protein A4E31_01506 [Methanomassiliicoccales archaeon PtaU1.Bin030]